MLSDLSVCTSPAQLVWTSSCSPYLYSSANFAKINEAEKRQVAILEIILHIGIAQFIFAALLALSRKPRRLSDHILAFWFGLMTIFMVMSLMKSDYPNSAWAKLQLFPFFFTLGPFLYLYVRTLCQQKQKLEFIDGLHLLPFIIFSVSAVTSDAPVDEDLLNGGVFQLNRLIYSMGSLASVAVYIPLTLKRLRRHRNDLLEYFSYTSAKISLNWLRMVVTGFSVMFALTFISALVNVAIGKYTIHPGLFLFLGFAAFAFTFTYFGIRQPIIYTKKVDERFVDEMEEVEEAEVEEESTGKYSHSSLSVTQAEQYIQQLTAYLEEGKPFIHRDLTIQDVAKELDIPQHHLTQAINEQLEKNFYTLVNEYRIEEVKKRLIDPKSAHLNILAIAHDAGFNSKSSFNMTFKKYTGMTPTQFRKEMPGASDKK